MSSPSPDVVVVGSGPNGLAAGITMARAGRSVRVLEAAATIGGGTRTEEVIEPGFLHDLCSAVHPFGVASPFFESLDLGRHGLEWIWPEIDLAHPLDDGRAALLHRDLESTASGFGIDGDRYRQLVAPLADRWHLIGPAILGPLLRVPRHPVALARFGLPALLPMNVLARRFQTDEVKALLAGCAGHSFLSLDHVFTSAFALMFAAASHTRGWPVAKGGSARLTDALAAELRSLGGEIEVDRRVVSMADTGATTDTDVFFDIDPVQVADIAGDRLPGGFRRKLRGVRPGPGVFKIDYTLDAPVPWTNVDCGRAGTVHVGGTIREVADAEAAVVAGRHAEHPFVLVAQQSLCDPSRAPEGKHTLWAYCHVPNGSTVDQTDAIERQIERFAPGFREVIRGRSTRDTAELEADNASYRGGAIVGGALDGLQLVARPTWRTYRTPDPHLWLCSAGTPPGGGVHGMCGFHAARTALRRDSRLL